MTVSHCDGSAAQYLCLSKLWESVLMLLLSRLLSKPCNVRDFYSEVLNMKCYTDLLALGPAMLQKLPSQPSPTPLSIAIYLNGFINSDSDHTGNTQERRSQYRKDMVRTKPQEGPSAKGRGWAEFTVSQVTQGSQLIGLFFPTGLETKAVQELFQAWS